MRRSLVAWRPPPPFYLGQHPRQRVVSPLHYYRGFAGLLCRILLQKLPGGFAHEPHTQTQREKGEIVKGYLLAANTDNRS
jgi:hypothetical protein